MKTSRLILSTGLLVTFLVALGTTVNYIVSGGQNPSILLKFVASGIYGARAFTGGTSMLILGLTLHAVISFCWTILYIKLYSLPRVQPWRLNRWILGLVYGGMIWFVMALIVLPASNAPFVPPQLTSSLVDIGIIVLGAGLPISLMTTNHHHQAHRANQKSDLMKYGVFILVAVSALLIGTGNLQRSSNSDVPYPEGYRNWLHIKTGMIGPESGAYGRFGGFHHIYGNKKAIAGFGKGKFQDGSIFVFDLFGMMDDGEGNISEGSRKFIDVMVKDSKKYSSTGGWGFEEFNGNSMVERNIKELAITQCFNCHKTRQNSDFIFSELRK